MVAAVKHHPFKGVSVKPCKNCGNEFYKNPKDSFDQWSEREFCSSKCAASKKLDPLHIRFWRYAVKSPNNACWEWTGTKDQHGYGSLGYEASSLKAHRISYELRFGPIPKGMVICHSCDNPSCSNPNHLFAGTQRDNARDMVRKGRMNSNSLLNLRPGTKGVLGAGPKSIKEINNGR